MLKCNHKVYCLFYTLLFSSVIEGASYSEKTEDKEKRWSDVKYLVLLVCCNSVLKIKSACSIL